MKRTELLKLARRVVDRYGTFIVRNQVSSYGSMIRNITDAVADGIEVGIKIGRQAERNEMLEIILVRDGEPNETEACDEAVPLAGNS